ncbi:MAG: hypothetical protein ABJ239_10780 [Erythrobacter sp.]
MMTAGKILVALSFILAMPSKAHACGSVEQFDISRIVEAEHVFVGKLTSYEAVSDGRIRIFTYSIDRTLAGENNGVLRVGWQNSTFSFPENGSVGLGERKIVAAIAPSEQYDLSEEQLGASEAPDAWVLQSPCTQEFVFPHTAANLREIQSVLAGGEPGDWWFHRPDFSEQLRQDRQRKFVLYGMLMLIALLIGGLIVRAKRS